MKYTLTFLFIIILLANILDAKETRLLRYPNTSKTHITFTYGGDLYTVPIQGGLARRITISDGIEIFPRFSPDGKTIAFSGEYDGNREVFVIPSEGGTPQRLTFSMDIPGLPDRMGPDKIIMQWTADGQNIIYRSRQESWNAWVGKLYNVKIQGGLPVELPLPKSGFASLSEDGNKIAYNRVFREFRTWKRYRGGQADDIWIYDFKTQDLQDITQNSGQDIIPMWYKNKIYYISDRDHFMNIFVYDINTKQTKKITNFDKYDVKFPSLGAEHISFENGGYIYLLNLQTEQIEKINIEVAEDFPWIRSKLENVKKNISSWNISPDGKRGLFSSRGDIFTVPAQNGKIVNLSKSSSVHDRSPEWSPDGKWIAYISDDGFQNEIYLSDANGKNKIQLTNNSKSYLWELKWSPDSRKILFSDKAMKLYVVDIYTKQIKEISKSKIWEIRDYNWSPDSKWIAYSDYINNFWSQINLYSIANGKSYKISDEFFESSSPVFSSDGKYLFFFSTRNFKPRVGNFEWNYMYENESNIFGLTLQDTLGTPFAFENDTVAVKVEEKEQNKGEKAKGKKDKKEEIEYTIKIDIDGMLDRLFEVPVKAAAYYRMVAGSKGNLYYTREGKLWSYDFNKKEESKVGEFTQFEISGDGKKIIYGKDNEYYITDLNSSVKSDEGKLDLSGMEVNIDRTEEWIQIFNESWRQMRDFFYDPNMHGVDWNAIKLKYSELLPYVVHRHDLTYIIGEMIGELNCGHSYVGDGEMPEVKNVGVGLLGADFTYDEKSGAYIITKILKGRNWEERTRSPLTESGINIKEGDYLYAVDGLKLNKNLTPFQVLNGKANRYVALSISSNGKESDEKDIYVKTIANESGLRYFNWVEENRLKVEKATNGRVGYIHIPDMSMEGLNEFVKYFYPQARKEALIVDDRYNGGGNVSPMIIERLRRILLVAKHARNQEEVMTNPDAVMTGPIVCLLNELAASDGDLFPYQFKKAGIGTLIGKRSWGGVIGIRGSLPFLDGSYMYKPEFANFGADGTWVLEGVGMEPDIEVDNHPAKEYNGIDEQLNKAIEVILEQIKTNTKPQIPAVPAFPDKSK
ncbi:MAG: PDZ domain-containing protein [bacterium]